MSRTAGVYLNRAGLWEIDKYVHGTRLRERFQFQREALEWLAKKTNELDRVLRFGEQPQLTFAEAVSRRLEEKLAAGQPSAESDSYHLKALLSTAGHLKLTEISDTSFDKFRWYCEREGKSAKTQHLSLSAAQAILNLASGKWRDPHSNRSYLQNPPKLTLPELKGKQRAPRSISRGEQAQLIAELPNHLKAMTIMAVNTGARDNVLVNLRWVWFVSTTIADQSVSFFVVPREYVKGRVEEKILVLNRIARDVVAKQRGRHSDFVFAWSRRFKGSGIEGQVNAQQDSSTGTFQLIQTMNNTAWQSARRRAGLPGLHVHDLRHTFATRLSAASVPPNVIAQLLWHSSKGVTEHYMGSQILILLAAVECIADAPEKEDVSLSTLITAHSKRIARGPSP